MAATTSSMDASKVKCFHWFAVETLGDDKASKIFWAMRFHWSGGKPWLSLSSVLQTTPVLRTPVPRISYGHAMQHIYINFWRLWEQSFSVNICKHWEVPFRYTNMVRSRNLFRTYRYGSIRCPTFPTETSVVFLYTTPIPDLLPIL
jgi:hypothetical protein